MVVRSKGRDERQEMQKDKRKMFQCFHHMSICYSVSISAFYYRHVSLSVSGFLSIIITLPRLSVSVILSDCLSVCLSVSLSVCLSVSLSVCLSIFYFYSSSASRLCLTPTVLSTCRYSPPENRTVLSAFRFNYHK
jgi:hypothetical protein